MRERNIRVGSEEFKQLQPLIAHVFNRFTFNATLAESDLSSYFFATGMRLMRPTGYTRKTEDVPYVIACYLDRRTTPWSFHTTVGFDKRTAPLTRLDLVGSGQFEPLARVQYAVFRAEQRLVKLGDLTICQIVPESAPREQQFDLQMWPNLLVYLNTQMAIYY